MTGPIRNRSLARLALAALAAILCALLPTAALRASDASRHALRLFGTGTGQQDRALVAIDDNAAGANASRPADVGAGGFTVEFWVRGNLADNGAPGVPQGSYNNFNWIEGNIVVDRDIWATGTGASRDWGVSLRGGRVAFGTGRNESAAAPDAENTIQGDAPVLDGAWHHVAVVRDSATGAKRIYVDGALDFEAASVSNDDLSFPDGGVIPATAPDVNAFLVLGAEKHDAGPGYPSFNGYLDEVRVWRRALSAAEVDRFRWFVLDPAAHADLVGYWRFEEGAGTHLRDSARGRATPGLLVAGTAGNGQWVARADDTASTAPVRPPVAVRAERIATGLSRPLYAVSPPGDTARLFIPEQHSGQIRIFNLDTLALNAVPFLTQSGLTTGAEQGLLGLVFHPDYAANGYFYINFTATGGTTNIVRYQRSAADPDLADPASAQTLLRIAQPFSNHNGGWMGFGPDGYLYVASGDGGGTGDPNNNAQSTGSLLGKILRLDVDGDDFPADPLRNYAIPPGNPFVGVAGEDEIWSFGLRNPWRCSFDRATGDFWIGDVGQSAQEEINFEPAATPGRNYGWKIYEGNSTYAPPPDPLANYTFPIHSYPRTDGRSVTGGYVYRGAEISGAQGLYFFGDYVTDRVWALEQRGGARAAFVNFTADLAPGGGITIDDISSFGEDTYGELYLTDLGGGELFRLRSNAPFDLWRIARFTRAELADPAISGPAADPDRDGRVNRLEYALGGDPRVPDVTAGAPALGFTGTGGQQYLTLNVNRPAGTDAVDLRVEATSNPGDPAAWSMADTVVLAETATTLVVRDRLPVGGNDRRFLRLRAD